MLRRLLPIVSLLLIAGASQADFRLTIIHTNDIHAHLEPTKVKNGTYGGYARLATLIEQYKKHEKNPIVLSAGDTFQGTLYFNMYEGLADMALMNVIGYNAMSLGNHEFDRGPTTLAAFIKQAQFPVLSANLDLRAEPELKELVKPSVVLTVGRDKVGIIGAVTPDLPTISSPGPNIKMLDWQTSVQAEVDRLTADGVTKILVLSHSGYEFEQEMAKKLRGVDVIVGAHSHTLLGTFTNTDFPQSRGPYPTMAKDADGNTTLVLQAWEWGKVLGCIQVDFDNKGHVKGWNNTAMRAVDDTVPDDPTVAALVAAFKKPIEAQANAKVGATETGIGREGENLMACVVADAQLAACQKLGAVAAFMNLGGVRSGVDAGPITFGEAIQVQPFNNPMVVVELTGDEIKRALEWGVRLMPEYSGGTLYVSKGTSYEVQSWMPEGERIVNVVIAGESLESAKSYKIAMNGFLAGGGDGHEVIKTAKGARQDSGILDIDAFVDYLKANSPLNPVAEGRIKVLKKASGLFRQNLDRAGVHVVKSGNDGSLTRIQRAA